MTGANNRGAPGIEVSVRGVEEVLKYEFKNKKLLEEALTHSSYTPRSSSASLYRLAFLGDAALCLAITSYFFFTYPHVDSGKLTALRSANVSTEKLARVALRHHLYHYLRRCSPNLDRRVKEFGITVQQEEELELHGGVMKAPKVLADIVESLIGAVYVDCGLDLNALWVIFRGLLEPIIMQNMLEEQPQPVRLLRGLCNKNGKQVNIQNLMKGNKHIASVYVDGKFISSASSECRGNAKRHAAKAALKELGYVPYEKMDIKLDLMKDCEGLKLLSKESERSKLLRKESDGKKLLTNEIERAKLLKKNRAPDEGIGIPVRAVEELLKYEFKNRKLLEEALTHSSYTPFCSSASYHRLTFLGYTALCLAISSYFFSTYPDSDCSKLTNLRDVNVCTEKLARVAVRHRLYHYLRCRDRRIDEKVKEFGITVQQEEDIEFYGGVMTAPKVLADIVASLAGAVYVDCGLDLNALWVIFRGLLEPIIMLNILEEQPQPVTLLNTLCDKDGKQVNIEHLIKGNKHIASIYVDGQFITSASSDYKRSAKRHAAKAALKELGYVPYQKTDVELDLMKDSERSKLLTKESEGSKLLTTESEGAKLLTKVCEGSKLLTEESEGSKLLTNEIEGSKLLKKESEGATLLTKESEGLNLLEKESEGSKLLAEESEGAKLLTNEREGVKLLTRNREPDEGIEIPVRAVEELLKYEFKNRKLLEEAFTHSSCTPSCSSTSYHRLTFLGYAALGLAISSYFFSTYPDIDCGKLTHLRDVNVSTEKLARVAVRHRLYHYLRHRDRHIGEKVKEFGITVQQEEDMEIYGGVMKAPKVLADIVASLTGAVYVDCGLDLNALWMIFRGLLEPIIMQNMLEEQPQPVRLLRGLCNKDGKQVNIQNLMKGNKHIARVDGQMIASASCEYKGSAKHHAAKAAREELGYGTYEKTDLELDLMKDSEGSKFLTKESEGSKLLTKESEGAKLLKKESEGSKLLMKESEGAKLLKKEIEGSKLLMKESEGAKLLTKEREGSQLLTKESESAKYDLNELCSRKKWSKPCYRIEKEVGLVHGKSFICSVQVAIAEGVLFVTGEEKSQVEDAERSAALAMIRGLKQEHIMNIPYSGYITPKGSEIFLCLSNKGQHEKQDEGIIEADQARTICSLETIADHNGQMEFEDQRSRKRKKTSSSLDCVASTHTVKKEKGS